MIIVSAFQPVIIQQIQVSLDPLTEVIVTVKSSVSLILMMRPLYILET